MEDITMNDKVVMTKTTEIRPYYNNPRKNDKSVKLLVVSIPKYGWLVPITVDEHGVIITGHSRYAAAKILGYDEVPVIVLDKLTKAKVSQFRIADNAVADQTAFDKEALDLRLGEFGEDFTQYFDGFGDDKTTTGNGVGDAEPEQKDDDVCLMCPHCLHEFVQEVTDI